MTDTDVVILGAISEVLDFPEVTAQDNFFSLGGDSLAAVELMERLEAQLDIEFPLETLLDSGEISELIHECKARVGRGA